MLVLQDKRYVWHDSYDIETETWLKAAASYWQLSYHLTKALILKSFIWHMTHDSWLMTHDSWHMTHDSWLMTHDSWHMTHDSWLMTHDSWLMTHDSWLMTHDSCHRRHGWSWRVSYFQLPIHFWQNKAHAPVVMRSLRFPGAVVVAQGPRFVCFYHGWGDVFDEDLTTPKLMPNLVWSVNFHLHVSCVMCHVSILSGQSTFSNVSFLRILFHIFIE
jgi:hypothetical protein